MTWVSQFLARNSALRVGFRCSCLGVFDKSPFFLPVSVSQQSLHSLHLTPKPIVPNERPQQHTEQPTAAGHLASDLRYFDSPNVWPMGVSTLPMVVEV